MNAQIYHHLQIFHAIVQTKGISAAARKLHISPPVVSSALKSLEQHIGLLLIQRNTRSMELTDAGQQLYQDTLPLMQSLNLAIESVQDLGETPTGTVRITVPRFAYHHIIKPHYAQFCRLYPKILLEISVFDGTIDIQKEQFDLGIRFGDKVADGMVARQLLPAMKDCLMVSPTYIAQYGIPKTPQELIHHRLIGYRFITAKQLLPLIINDGGEEREIDMPLSLIVNDEVDLLVDATRQGLGIGRIFESTLNQQPDRENFIPILQDYWVSYAPVYLYYHQHSQKAKRIKVLIDFLLDKMTQIA